MTTQTKQTHTPGPWTTMSHKGHDQKTNYTINQQSNYRGYDLGRDEDSANARLIAACPTMYEAITHAISDLDNHIAQYPSAKTLLPELRAYLAKVRDKAEGKE